MVRSHATHWSFPQISGHKVWQVTQLWRWLTGGTALLIMCVSPNNVLLRCRLIMHTFRGREKGQWAVTLEKRVYRRVVSFKPQYSFSWLLAVLLVMTHVFKSWRVLEEQSESWHTERVRGHLLFGLLERLKFWALYQWEYPEKDPCNRTKDTSVKHTTS